jgi:hypothetical protein
MPSTMAHLTNQKKDSDFYLIEINSTTTTDYPTYKNKPYMRNHTFYLALTLMLSLLFFVACNNPKVTIPADVIKPDSMVMVLADVHVAEASLVQKNIQGKSGNNYAASFYKYVFEKNKITPAQYQKSIEFYASNPDIYKTIYEQVITELSKRQASESAK